MTHRPALLIAAALILVPFAAHTESAVTIPPPTAEGPAQSTGLETAVLAGVAVLNDEVTFQIDLNGKLPTGNYTIMALIAVNGNAMNAAIRHIPTRIVSGR